jgi:hypothetical protein
VLFGVAILLRPEAACFFVAVLVAAYWLDSAQSKWRIVGLVIFGAGVALVPLEAYTLVHLGSAMPSHLGANFGLLQAGWVSQRLQLATEWLLPAAWSGGPTQTASFWNVAPATVLAVGSLAVHGKRSDVRFLWTAAGLTIALVLLTAPNDGGSQWGPRYLLLAYVPLTVLAGDAIDALPRRNIGAWAALALVLLGCLWIQRSAYRQLRGTKLTYGQVVDFVTTQVEPGGYVVTDLWWLDQVAAAATSERQLVYAPDATAGEGAMQRLSRAMVDTVTVIRSRSESPDTTAWISGSCFVETKRQTVSVRDLVAITVQHRCPAGL